MLVRVESVGVVDDVIFGVAEGVEFSTGKVVRFVGDRGDLLGLQMALEAGKRPMYDVTDPLKVIAIDGVYPHEVRGTPELVIVPTS